MTVRNYKMIGDALLGRWRNNLDLYILSPKVDAYLETYFNPTEIMDLLITIIDVFQDIISNEVDALRRDKTKVMETMETMEEGRKECEKIDEKKETLIKFSKDLYEIQAKLINYHNKGISKLLPYRDD